MEPVYADRVDAGRHLARVLGTPDGDPVVVGLANGGVVVAAEVARELELPLDAVAVVKIGHPTQPEYAIGAVAPGVVLLRAETGLSPGELQSAVAAAVGRCRRLDGELHAHAPVRELVGGRVLLVDDGLATGATMLAAVRWARAAGAERIVACVPVAAAQSVDALRVEADDIVCPEETMTLRAVAEWYESFAPVGTEEVAALLEAAAAPDPPAP
jgi:putative phosphoribosyl transferase